MNKLAAFLSLMSLIVSCGSVSEVSTNHVFRDDVRIEEEIPQPAEKTEKIETEPAAEQEPEQNEIPKESTADIPQKNNKVTEDFYAVSNKGSGWGFVKKKGVEPEIYSWTAELFAKHNTYYLDPARTKKIYLTFDEGYENGYTAQILDTLAEHNAPAAFFITGDYMKRETALVDRMIAEGHIVGNHTENHPNLHKLEEPQKMAEELEILNNSFYERYQKNMEYMRPPEGEYSERVLSVADSLGYKTILWSFAYRDWDPKTQKGADYAFEQVAPYLHDGAIILLHAVSKDNTEALPRIIEYARANGYEFAGLDELAEY